MLGEETLSNIVLNSLRPEIKSRLRGVHFGTLKNLENAATQVERDLAEMSVPPIRQKSSATEQGDTRDSMNRRERFAKDQQRNEPQQLQCFVCGGPHFDRTCPRAIESGRNARVAVVEETSREDWRPQEYIPDESQGVEKRRPLI